jgi:Zn-dependent peptidase ImmA (M78 family)
MASIRAKINPQVLAWARTSSGFSLEIAARKIGGRKFAPARLESWERGESYPTVSQLRKIAQVYKRPVAAFFLDSVPRDFSVPKDFRHTLNVEQGPISPELRLEIRLAEERRGYALELYGDLEESPQDFKPLIGLTDDPVAVARSVRDLLQVSLEEQVEWQGSNSYPALRAWRARVEALGILVFQFKGVKPEEAMGFSLGETPLPVISINRHVYPTGRIFSLMHELVHILLRQGGICEDFDRFDPDSDSTSIEAYCNKTAAEILVPSEGFLAQAEVQQVAQTKTSDPTNEQIAGLATRYSVSHEVIARRFLSLGLVSESFYRQKRVEFQNALRAALKWRAEELRIDQEEGKEFKRSPASEAASLLGPTFTRLVLESYRQGGITLSDVSSYLGVRVRHLPRVQELVFAS